MDSQVVHAPAAMTWPHAMAVLAQLLPAARACAGVIDLAALQHFDSSALAVLLAVRRQCGPGTCLRHPAPGLRALAALYGVESLLFAAPQTSSDS